MHEKILIEIRDLLNKRLPPNQISKIQILRKKKYYIESDFIGKS